jgi:hypothetical protein
VCCLACAGLCSHSCSFLPPHFLPSNLQPLHRQGLTSALACVCFCGCVQVLMVAPTAFVFNAQAAQDNTFMNSAVNSFDPPPPPAAGSAAAQAPSSGALHPPACLPACLPAGLLGWIACWVACEDVCVLACCRLGTAFAVASARLHACAALPTALPYIVLCWLGHPPRLRLPGPCLLCVCSPATAFGDQACVARVCSIAS